MRTFILLCLSIPASACVTDDGEQADNTEPEVSTTESALCGSPSSPPAYDYRYAFQQNVGGTFILPISGYGSGICSNHVVKLENPTNFSNPGNMTVYMPTSTLPDEVVPCLATTMTVRTFRIVSGGLSVHTATHNAEWTATGCAMPPRVVVTMSGVTVEMSAQRAAWCPRGSTICHAAAYGLPVRLKIEDFE